MSRSAAAKVRQELFSTLASRFAEFRKQACKYAEWQTNMKLDDSDSFIINHINNHIEFSSNQLFYIITDVLLDTYLHYSYQFDFEKEGNTIYSLYLPFRSSFEELYSNHSAKIHRLLFFVYNHIVELVRYSRKSKNPYVFLAIWQLNSILNVIHRVISERITQACLDLEDVIDFDLINNQIQTHFIDLDSIPRHKKKFSRTPQNIHLNVLIHAYFEPPYDYPFAFQLDDIQAEELERSYLRNSVLPQLQLNLLNFVGFMYLINPDSIRPTFSINRTSNCIRLDIWGDEYLLAEKRKFYNLKQTYLAEYFEE